MNYPESIRNLIECYKKLPGVGEKTAERYALASLSFEPEITDLFSKTIKNVKSKIKKCKICNYYCEDDICDICKDKTRNKKMICVVEEPKNVILFEKVGTYNGVYHVLGGLISPIDGMGRENIDIDGLLARIKDQDEVIMALKPNIEGETTTLYINKLLLQKNAIVTKIAHGVPLGTEMEYIDSLTLEMALEDRKKIS